MTKFKDMKVLHRLTTRTVQKKKTLKLSRAEKKLICPLKSVLQIPKKWSKEKRRARHQRAVKKKRRRKRT